MAQRTQLRAAVVALLVVASVTVTAVPFVGVAAAAPTVSVDHAATVSPGERTTITVNGTAAGELTVRGDVAGWVVNGTSPAGFTTVPSPGETPYESQAGDAWGHVFFPAGDRSFEVVVTAPDRTGTYNFTAEAKGDGTTVTRNFSVRVAEQTVSVDHAANVTAGGQTTVTVEGTDTAELSVEGEVDGWVVNDTTPATLTTFPSPGETPYESNASDTWGHLFATPGSHTFEVVVTAPDAAGTYNFTAVATNNGSDVTESFGIAVEEPASEPDPEPGPEPDPVRHESGVLQSTFDAVAGSDGQLSRAELLTAVTNYAQRQPVGGVTLNRSAVLDLVTYYVGSR